MEVFHFSSEMRGTPISSNPKRKIKENMTKVVCKIYKHEKKLQ
jgi:hypothetical protein